MKTDMRCATCHYKTTLKTFCKAYGVTVMAPCKTCWSAFPDGLPTLQMWEPAEKEVPEVSE